MAARKKSAIDTTKNTVDRSLSNADQKAKTVYAQVKRQVYKPVTLAPAYKDYFGETMTVKINGMSIYVPVNGRTYKVPKDFAALIQERRRRVDDMLNKQAALANVTENKEQFAGQLELIPK